MLGQVKMRLILQSIKGILRVLQKLLKYFNVKIISISFVLLETVSLVIFCLDIDESMLLLAAGKLVILPLASKKGSSL